MALHLFVGRSTRLGLLAGTLAFLGFASGTDLAWFVVAVGGGPALGALVGWVIGRAVERRQVPADGGEARPRLYLVEGGRDRRDAA